MPQESFLVQHVATALQEDAPESQTPLHTDAKQGMQKQLGSVGVTVQQSPENGLRIGWVMLMQEQQVQQP